MNTVERTKQKEKEFERWIEEFKDTYYYDANNTGLFICIKQTTRKNIGDIGGWIQNEGYRIIEFKGYRIPLHRLAWRLHTGQWPKHLIDHINGIHDDNRICNLREANHSINNSNNANKRQISGSHYNTPSQVWDFVHDNGISYLAGNVIKYVARYKNKNGVEDLNKAKHYIEKLIEKESTSELQLLENIIDQEEQPTHGYVNQD